MRISLSSLVLVGAIAVSAGATSYREAPPVVGAAASSAPTVTGWVRAVRAEQIGRRISTVVTLELENPAPGEPATIEFRSPGGTVDGVAMRVTGAPRFDVGEHVRVTVRETRQGLRLSGLASGKEVLP